jgi:hypothetical protein
MRILAAFGWMAALIVTGCGQSDTISVTGTVTLNGKPADQAEVMFTPAEGRMASGVTDSSGRFELSTNSPGDGAVPGDHKVTVVEYYPPGKPPPMTPGPLPSRFPAKYGDSSQTPFSAKVQRGQKNDFKFDMEGSPSGP